MQVCRKTKPNKTLAKSLGAPPAGQPRRRQAGPTGQRATQPGQGEAGLDRGVGAATASRARGDGERRRREAAQRGGARAGKEGCARRCGGGGAAHQRRRGRGAAAEERHDGARRRRTEALVAGPAGRERGPGEGQNRRMTAQGSSPSEESRRCSPERVNRRRGWSSAAAAMVERVRV